MAEKKQTNPGTDVADSTTQVETYKVIGMQPYFVFEGERKILRHASGEIDRETALAVLALQGSRAFDGPTPA